MHGRARADQDPFVWEGEEWDSLRNFNREVFSPGKVFPATKRCAHAGESSLIKLPGLFKNIFASGKFTPQRVIISFYCANAACMHLILSVHCDCVSGAGLVPFLCSLTSDSQQVQGGPCYPRSTDSEMEAGSWCLN